MITNAHEARRTTALMTSGVVLHVLPEGSTFDLTTRALVRDTLIADPAEAAELAAAGAGLGRLARDIAAGDVSPSVLRKRRARRPAGRVGADEEKEPTHDL